MESFKPFCRCLELSGVQLLTVTAIRAQVECTADLPPIVLPLIISDLRATGAWACLLSEVMLKD
jgi:hypothetical protein